MYTINRDMFNMPLSKQHAVPMGDVNASSLSCDSLTDILVPRVKLPNDVMVQATINVTHVGYPQYKALINVIHVGYPSMVAPIARYL